MSAGETVFFTAIAVVLLCLLLAAAHGVGRFNVAQDCEISGVFIVNGAAYDCHKRVSQ